MVRSDRAGQNQPGRTADWFRMTVLYYSRPLTFGANGLPTDPTWVDPTSTLLADLQNPNRALWIRISWRSLTTCPTSRDRRTT